MPFVESFHMIVVGTLLGRMAYALYLRTRYVTNGRMPFARTGGNAICCNHTVWGDIW